MSLDMVGNFEGIDDREPSVLGRMFDNNSISDEDAIVQMDPPGYYKLTQFDVEHNNTPNPPSKRIQRVNVRRYLNQPVRDDEVWCVISGSWMNKWKEHVGYDTIQDDMDEDDQGGDGAPGSEETEGEDQDDEGEDDVGPGPIDNSEIVKNFEVFQRWIDETGGDLQKTGPQATKKHYTPVSTLELRDDMLEHKEYELLPAGAWERLLSWYGGKYNGYAPTIPRFTYSAGGAAGGQCNIDLFPLMIPCAGVSTVHQTVEHLKFDVLRFSRSLALDDIANVILWFNNVEVDGYSDGRIWLGYLFTPWKVIGEDNVDLFTYGYNRFENRQLIAEHKETMTGTYLLDEFMPTSSRWGSTRTGGSYISGSGSSSGGYWRSGGSSYEDFYKNQGRGSTSTPGVCGFENLGNTCYMNSGLQCLCHVKSIRRYFTSGSYKKEINKDNPLGQKGEIATSFGELMELMWSGDHSYVVPRGFKSVIGTFNNTFAGYGQQDSHELIASLLDGIHEDMNRIKKKPSTEAIEGYGRLPEEVANESWKNHMKRNDSIIVEKFQGQLRSELNCPHCNRISVTFDPYMYLSVPIPVKEKKRELVVTVVFRNNRKQPIRYTMKISRDGYVANLKQRLAEITGIKDASSLLVGDVYNKKVFEFYMEEGEIRSIKKSDEVFAFELAEGGIHKYMYQTKHVLPVSEYRMFMLIPKEYPDGRQTLVRRRIISFPFVVTFQNGVTSGKDMHVEALKLLRSFMVPDAREILLKNSDGMFDLDDPDTLFQKVEKKKVKRWRKENAARKRRKEKEEREKKKKEEKEKKKKEEKERKKKEGKDDDNDADSKKKKDSDDEDITTGISENATSLSGMRSNVYDKGEVGDGRWSDDDNNDHIPSYVDDMDPSSDSDDSGKDNDDNDKKEDDDDKKMEDPFLLLECYTEDDSNSRVSDYDKTTVYYHEEQVIEMKTRQRFGYVVYYSSFDELKHVRINVRFHQKFVVGLFDEEKLGENFIRSVEHKETIMTEEEKKKTSQPKVITLRHCIEKFCEKETLKAPNEWYCRDCKKHVEASKKFDIWKLPEVLIVHLKRFKNQEQAMYRSKIEEFVDFPMLLDMTKFTINRKNKHTSYDLIGVSNHMGGMGGGHYTAYAKTPKSLEEDVDDVVVAPEVDDMDVEDDDPLQKKKKKKKKTQKKKKKDTKVWYEFDDWRTNKARKKEVVSREGYVLFYESVNSTQKYSTEKKGETTTTTPKDAEETPKGDDDDDGSDDKKKNIAVEEDDVMTQGD